MSETDPVTDQPAPTPSSEDLRAVVDAHAGAVYRVAVSIVHDGALAEDVVQETMIKAWRHAPVEAGEEIPRQWLLKVARNTAISTSGQCTSISAEV